MLEIEADFLRETLMDSISLSFMDSKMAARVLLFKEHEGKKYIVVKRGLYDQEEFFLFPVQQVIADDPQSNITGVLMDDEPGRISGNSIYVIESEKLKHPTKSTLKIL